MPTTLAPSGSSYLTSGKARNHLPGLSSSKSRDMAAPVFGSCMGIVLEDFSSAHCRQVLFFFSTIPSLW